MGWGQVTDQRRRTSPLSFANRRAVPTFLTAPRSGVRSSPKENAVRVEETDARLVEDAAACAFHRRSGRPCPRRATASADGTAVERSWPAEIPTRAVLAEAIAGQLDPRPGVGHRGRPQRSHLDRPSAVDPGRRREIRPRPNAARRRRRFWNLIRMAICCGIGAVLERATIGQNQSMAFTLTARATSGLPATTIPI